MAFFTILTVFYGIPIYIIRDLYMTMRSFTKRITDYLRFQAATRDMDTRYPNATAQDLAADNTCIVCREEMRPIDAEQAPAAGGVGQALHQRQKPKKLPCGHILHFGCLSSWLERQQACPICRRSVFATGTGTVGTQGAPAQAGQAPAAGGGGANPQNQNLQQRGQQNQGRVFRLGPLRIQLGGQIGRPNDQELLNALGRLAQNHRQNIQRNRENLINGAVAGPAGTAGATAATGNATQSDGLAPSVTDPANSDIHPGIRSAAARMALNTVEQQIQREIQALNIQGQRANTIRNLLNELDRARNIPQPPLRQQPRASVTPGGLQPINGALPSTLGSYFQPHPLNQNQQTFPFGRAVDPPTAPYPSGVVVPQGWQLVPLHPITDQAVPGQAPAQMLQAFLQHSANPANQPTRGSSAAIVQPGNPLVAGNPLAQFLAGAVNESGAVQSPFPPPPPRPAPVNGSSVRTTNGSSTVSDIPATNGDDHSSPTPSSSSHTTHSMSTAPPPTAPAQTWSFPPATASVTTSSSAEMTPTHSGKGKAPAVTVPEQIPQTHVEPPTPVEPPVETAGERTKQPSVEDAGDEE
jgi:E3 ubiquitin-protein ligase synoviolin